MGYLQNWWVIIIYPVWMAGFLLHFQRHPYHCWVYGRWICNWRAYKPTSSWRFEAAMSNLATAILERSSETLNMSNIFVAEICNDDQIASKAWRHAAQVKLCLRRLFKRLATRRFTKREELNWKYGDQFHESVQRVAFAFPQSPRWWSSGKKSVRKLGKISEH